MKKAKLILLIALLAATFPIVTQSATKTPDIILIRNGKIITVTGETIDGGDILIKGNKIVKVGRNLNVPAGTIIDATGLEVYPGFIDSYSNLGLSEISSVRATADYREIGKYNPEIRAAWAINPDSVHFGTSRLTGITTALVAPMGGEISGFSALVKMNGWTFDELTLKEVVTSSINFPRAPRRRSSKPEKKPKTDIVVKFVEKLSEYLKEARLYLSRKELAEKNGKIESPQFNPKFEALKPILNGEIPVIILADKVQEIETAIGFAEKEKIRIILRGCAQGYLIAGKIKKAGVPVIINSLYAGPAEFEDGYDGAWTNVATLSKAGVKICFSSGRNLAGKDLTYHAARAVAFGMEHSEAIRALTINPAVIFGVEKRIGSIEAGKDADIIITSGDPLDIKTEVKTMIIGGKMINSYENHWYKLYDKWRKRPPSTK